MLVFAGLWTQCDKEGYFPWKPRTLKLDILPFLDFSFEETLAILLKHNLLIHQGDYGFIPTFTSHQLITGKEGEEPARYAEKARHSRDTVGTQQGAQEGKGREGKGMDIAPASPVKRSIDLFYQLHKEKTGHIYVVNGQKDGAIVKRLLGSLSEEELRGRMAAFFESEDTFIERAGRTIGVFASQVNKLVVKKVRPVVAKVPKAPEVLNEEFAKALSPEKKAQFDGMLHRLVKEKAVR